MSSYDYYGLDWDLDLWVYLLLYGKWRNAFPLAISYLCYPVSCVRRA